MLALLLHIVLRDEYIEGSEMTSMLVLQFISSCPQCPLNAEWPTVEEHPFIASQCSHTTTTTQTSACALNVSSGPTFLPMHALHCVSSHCDHHTHVLVDSSCTVCHSCS